MIKQRSLKKHERKLIHLHLTTGTPSLGKIAVSLRIGSAQKVYPLIREYALELVHQLNGEV